MFLEIEEKLFEKYENLLIRVSYVEMRKYKIEVISTVVNDTFIYEYEPHLTLDTNISIIEHKIDNCILQYYKK